MAKLSANGTEVARYVRQRERNDHPILRDATYISVRSNGKVLRKHVAVIHDPYHPKGFRSVTKGWKQWARIGSSGQSETLTVSLDGAGYQKIG